MVKAFLASVSSGLGAKPVGETSAKYEAEEVEVEVGTDELELAGKLEGTDCASGKRLSEDGGAGCASLSSPGS